MDEKPEVEVLNVMRGGTPVKPKIYVREGSEEDRRELAKAIEKMIRSGHAVFLLKSGTEDAVEKEADYRIHGYDPETNEWIVYLPSSQKGKKRVSAKGTKALSVAPVAGG